MGEKHGCEGVWKKKPREMAWTGASSSGEMDKNTGRQDDECGREQTRDSEGVRARVRQES